MTVTLMIIVNNAGNGATTFAPLHHAKWHGFTPTDWIFPTFLFVVGNAMSFSLVKFGADGHGQFLKKVLKRTVIIFILGYLIYWFPFVHEQDGHIVFKAISETRIFGVLQRIALCYLFASLVIHYLKENGAVVFSVFALLAYWFLLFAYGDYTLAGNAVLKLDLALFGPNHLYHGSGIAFDPEGLLSTLPAIVNVIAGYLAGRFIQQKGNSFETIAKLMIAGTLLLFVALSWDMVFPINKRIWTSSFVLYSLGWDLLILSTLIFIIDIKNERRWTYFFEVFGKNTLFIYVLSEIGTVVFTIKIGDETLDTWLYQHVFRLTGDYIGSLLFAMGWMFVCWSVGYWMDRKKIYVKV